MKTFLKVKFSFMMLFTLFLTSCVKDLDKEPLYGLNAASVYKDYNNYKPLIAKIYGGLSNTGSNGPNSSDIVGLDGGSSGYIRCLWKLEELTSDEAICGWNDPGIPDLNNNTWSASNQFIIAMYYRIYYQIALSNEFLRQTESGLLDDRGFNQDQKNQINTYRAEIRFLRAMNYYHLIDLFGKGPYIPEDIGGNLPKERNRTDHFNFIESELKIVEGQMGEPRTVEYGRADRASAWTLLSKLYLNAKTYTGNERFADAAIYAKKVIDAGYTLEPKYGDLFLTDNFRLTNEIIFPILSDGLSIQSFGLTTFLAHASVDSDPKKPMKADDYGINSGWGGIRAKQNLSKLLPDILDSRNQFFTKGQYINVDTVNQFDNGYALPKFKNIDSNKKPGKDETFVDTDFPLYRLGDVYLMYAEALLRSGGSQSEALLYVNKLRFRAYGNNSGDLSSINIDQILDERARELHWEAMRRSDLIRFDKYTTGSYLWPFKGGVKEGAGLDDAKKLFPIPQLELTANPNISQNPGY